MNEQQLAAVKLALKALRFAGDDGYQNEVSQQAITAIKQVIAQDALDKKADNARELGLSYDDEPKIGCVNHDCDKCKAVQEPWVGLTDEEVNHLLEHTDWLDWPHLFAKAIEAKLKEKNT